MLFICSQMLQCCLFSCHYCLCQTSYQHCPSGALIVRWFRYPSHPVEFLNQVLSVPICSILKYLKYSGWSGNSQEMFVNSQEMSGKNQEMSVNLRKWSGKGLRWSGNGGQKCSEKVWKWSEMVRKCLGTVREMVMKWSDI